MKKIKKLQDEYRFPGFYPRAVVKGKFGDHKARVIQLVRRQKKLPVVIVEQFIRVSTTEKLEPLEICPVVMLEFIWKWKYGGLTV